MLLFSTDRNKYNKDKCMFLLYVHANAVNNNKGSSNNSEPDNAVSMEFTLKVFMTSLTG